MNKWSWLAAAAANKVPPCQQSLAIHSLALAVTWRGVVPRI